MKVTIEKTKVAAPVSENRAAGGGKTVSEARADGVQWLNVEFSRSMRIAWNWDDLLGDACAPEANLNLAMAGLVLSYDVEHGARKGEAVLRQLGFDEIRSEYYLLSTETRNEVSNPARTFGHKVLMKNGKPCHVFCAVFRGTSTLRDTITDIKSVIDGFFEGGKNGTDSLRAYINSFKDVTTENTILFITGHSLGAATANVAGRLSREFAKAESTFVYSFASPNYETDGEWNNGKAYPNFHYYSNIDDVVPTVPPRIPPTFFSKIGKEHLFNYEAMDNNQKQRFERAYRYFKGKDFKEDKDFLGLGLGKTESAGYKTQKNHLCHTYMSFILSELADSEIGNYLAE